MFDTILGFGNQTFAVLFLVVSAGISAHISYGFGTRRAKEMFVGLILLLLVSVQMFYLISASVHIPSTRFHTYDESVKRLDCLKSGKGGKRALDSYAEYDKNPCFCHDGAYCMDASTGLFISSNNTCPTDGTATCKSVNGNVEREISLYIEYTRNCHGRVLSECSMDHPCDSCDISSYWSAVTAGSVLSSDVSTASAGMRCRSCTTENKGACHFVPGIGPYCRKSAGSKAIVPCSTCCTASAVVNYTDASTGISTCY